MANPLQKVRPGDPLKIPAELYNAMIDAVAAVREMRRTGGNAISGQSSNPFIVHVRNDTGNEVEQFGIIGIGAPIVTKDDNETEFRNNPKHFSGELPDLEDHAGRWAVVLQHLTEDYTGAAVIGGITPVKVDVVSEAHAFADLKDGDVEKLESADAGPARILWKETGTGTKWALIKFPEGAASLPFDPLFAIMSSPQGQDCLFGFLGSDSSRIGSLGNLTFAEAGSPLNSANAYDLHVGNFCFRDGRGVVFANRSGSLHRKVTGFLWSGPTPSSGDEAPLEDVLGATYNSRISGSFILADGSVRVVHRDTSLGAASSYLKILKLGLNGATATGTMTAKAATSQPVGSTTLQVTLSDPGSLSAIENSAFAVGSGDSYRVYQASGAASGGSGANVTIGLQSTLSVALSGGELVRLVESWWKEWESDQPNLQEGYSLGLIHPKGFPLDKYVVNTYPITNSSGTAQVDRGLLYFDGTDWEVLKSWVYPQSGADHNGCVFSCVGVCQDGTIWAVGRLQRTISSAEYGLFRYDDGDWIHVIPELPSGWTFASGEVQVFMVYLPDGRLVVPLPLYNSTTSKYGVGLYVLNSSDDPELIKGPIVGPIILQDFGAGVYSIGCGLSGPKIYLWNGVGFIGACQIISTGPEYINIPPNGFVELSGAPPESTITGTLAAKAATVQPIGTNPVVLTTGSGSACDLKNGDRFKIGERVYTIAVDAAQPSENSDVSVSISPSLSVALVGGEAVTPVNGWSDRIVQVRDIYDQPVRFVINSFAAPDYFQVCK